MLKKTYQSFYELNRQKIVRMFLPPLPLTPNTIKEYFALIHVQHLFGRLVLIVSEIPKLTLYIYIKMFNPSRPKLVTEGTVDRTCHARLARL